VHRFYAPAIDPGDDTVVLPKEEGEHLARVLRLGVGDTVSVFDGRGREYAARVVAAAPRETRVQLLTRVEPAAELSVSLVLAQAVLKGDKMDEVVRDAVMLGVAAIQPIVTRRSEVTVAALLRGARPERWRRVALASVKQSRRAVVPEIRTPLSFETYLAEPRPASTYMLVEPGAGAPAEPLGVLRGAPPPTDVALMVGPEGGWADNEWTEAAAAGVRLITLGRQTLRADAVAVAAISVLAFLWDGN
jgi:16S rRNA (uracil1498-N3)-methyltransferase